MPHCMQYCITYNGFQIITDYCKFTWLCMRWLSHYIDNALPSMLHWWFSELSFQCVILKQSNLICKMLSFSRQAASSMQVAIPLYILLKPQSENACVGICFLKIDKEININWQIIWIMWFCLIDYLFWLKGNDMIIILTVHNAFCVSNRTWNFFFVEVLVLVIPYRSQV